eukprot:TRINITY_DN21960_c0_g1_i1.p1 TRINITY_DN21960_c0_g1~~TRINITY_DN21960_c0_g1_i1.p1  ORF type:complete len:389 (-),score=79.92 TRINITY_DN21960_c0_g1_i1:20-1186(-)
MNCFKLGLFSFGSQFNHSCAPNALRFIWHDGWSIVFCLRDLAPGEEVTLSYGFVDSPWWWRQWRLFWKYGFFCCCSRCQDGHIPDYLAAFCGRREEGAGQRLSGWLIDACELSCRELPEGGESDADRPAALVDAARDPQAATELLAALSEALPAPPTRKQSVTKRLVELRTAHFVDRRAAEPLVPDRQLADKLARLQEDFSEAARAGDADGFASTGEEWLQAFVLGSEPSCIREAVLPAAELHSIMDLLQRQLLGMVAVGVLPVAVGYMEAAELRRTLAAFVSVFAPGGAFGVAAHLTLEALLGDRLICTVLLVLSSFIFSLVLASSDDVFDSEVIPPQLACLMVASIAIMAHIVLKRLRDLSEKLRHFPKHSLTIVRKTHSVKAKAQ